MWKNGDRGETRNEKGMTGKDRREAKKEMHV